MQATTVQELPHSSQYQRSYICPKCNSVFENFDTFNTHLKGLCVMESVQKPYCIIYNPQNTATSNKKRLNLSVDDYFYGHVEGSNKHKKKVVHRKFSCYSCGKLLRNNLRFMSHVRHKIENELRENDSVNDFNICSHCHRRYTSPFHLQCHIETVHTPAPAATTCRICELNFNNEELFLCHMKDLHNYNEMPYVCRVCSYRSSFYHDVIQHFKLNHENCSSLQCSFCLAIHQTANSFLSHVIQHMNKYLRCCKCRLQFFNAKDKSQHLKTDHLSVQSVPGKKVLPKNPSQYTIFVKVSHHPLSPSKNRPPSNLSLGLSKDSSAVANLSLEHGWMLDSQEDEDIPLEFQPFVRNSNISVVLSSKAAGIESNKCTECGDILGFYPARYNRHFQKEHRCSKCTFHTHCPKAMKKHILKTHLNHIKQGDMSKYSSVGELYSFNGETAGALQSKASSSHDANFSSWNNEKFLQSWSPVRRKRSHSPNVSPGSNLAVDWHGQIDLTVDEERVGGLTTRPEPMHCKRTKTDLNTFLDKVVHENQLKLDNCPLPKPRRKQLKPQKVASTDEGSPAPVLKPLSKIVDEAESHEIRSGSPPDLVDVLGDSDESDNRKTSRKSHRKRTPTIKMNFKSNRSKGNSSSDGAAMLSASFASQLGLGKKKKQDDQAKNVPLRKSRVYISNPQQLSAPPVQSESIALPIPSNIKWIQQPQTTVSSNQPAKQTQFTVRSTIISDAMFDGNRPRQAVVRKPSNIDTLRPPSNITFSEVTKSSFLVSWTPPPNCSVTQYKLIFQGSGLPTTQALPPAQTTVRLIGLRSSTRYLVRLCSVYKNHCSRFADSLQDTLALREKKNMSPAKADDVIVLDDDDDDDVIVVNVPSSQPAVCSDSGVTSKAVEKVTSNVSGSPEGGNSGSTVKPQLTQIKPIAQSKSGPSSRSPTIIIPDPGPHKKLFLVNKTKVSSMKMADITSLKLVKPSEDKPKGDDTLPVVDSNEESNAKSPKPMETNGDGPKPQINQTESSAYENHAIGNEVDGDEMDGNEVNGNEVDGNEMDGNEVDGNEVDGNEMDGNEVGGNEVDGNEVDGNEVDGNKMDGNEVDGNEMDGNEVDGNELDGNEVDGNEVDVNEVNGNEVDGNEVDGNELDGNEVDGNEVDVNEVDGNEVDGNEVDGNEVDVNEVDGDEVDVNEVDGNGVDVNEVDGDEVDVNELDGNEVDENEVDREVNASDLVRKVSSASKKELDEPSVVEAATADNDDEELLQDIYVLVPGENVSTETERNDGGTKSANFDKATPESAIDIKEGGTSVENHVTESVCEDTENTEEPIENDLAAKSIDIAMGEEANSLTTNEEDTRSLASSKDDSTTNGIVEIDQTTAISTRHSSDVSDTVDPCEILNGIESDEIDSDKLLADVCASITEDLAEPSLLEDSTKVSAAEENSSKLNGIDIEETKIVSDTNEQYSDPLTSEDLDHLWNLLNE